MATTTLRTRASDIPIDEDVWAQLDDRAFKSIHELVRWARAHAGDYGVRVADARVSLWRSAEEQQDTEVVINIAVQGDDDAALCFWDAVSSRLGALAEARPSAAARSLAVEVHWQ